MSYDMGFFRYKLDIWTLHSDIIKRKGFIFHKSIDVKAILIHYSK